VVFGLRSPVSAVIAGFYLGSPLFTNLFPGTVPVPVIMIGVAGVALGRDPNGLIPKLSSRLDVIRRRPTIAAALGFGVAVAWVLVLTDILTGGQWFGVTAALVVAALVIAEVDERSAGGPERSSGTATQRWMLALPGRRSEALDEPASESTRFSAPVEALGLLVPFTDADVAALDRELALPGASGRNRGTS